MSGTPPNEDAAFSEFLFGPRDNDDGTTPAGEEERRRIEAIVLHAKREAEKLGLQIQAETVRPHQPAAPSGDAASIKRRADETMPAADERVRNEFSRESITLPDGTSFSRTRIRLECLDKLSETLKAFADTKWLEKFAGRVKIDIRFMMKLGGTPQRKKPHAEVEEKPAVTETVGDAD